MDGLHPNLGDSLDTFAMELQVVSVRGGPLSAASCKLQPFFFSSPLEVRQVTKNERRNYLGAGLSLPPTLSGSDFYSLYLKSTPPTIELCF